MQTVITRLQWSHQIGVNVRDTTLWDGDQQRLKSDMAVNLALLTAEARSRPCRDVAGQTAPDESRRDKATEASLPGREMLCKFKKIS
jgi:hypothetical protein